jgi:hypothetical protein
MSLPASREASASTFFSDATMNGCGVGVDNLTSIFGVYSSVFG